LFPAIALDHGRQGSTREEEVGSCRGFELRAFMQAQDHTVAIFSDLESRQVNVFRLDLDEAAR